MPSAPAEWWWSTCHPSLGHGDPGYLILEMTFLYSPSNIAIYVNHAGIPSANNSINGLEFSIGSGVKRLSFLLLWVVLLTTLLKSLLPKEFPLWSQTSSNLSFVVSEKRRKFCRVSYFQETWISLTSSILNPYDCAPDTLSHNSEDR